MVLKRMCQHNETGFLFAEREREKKHPPLSFIVWHSQRKSRGRVNAVILFRGQRGTTHTLCLKDMHLAPFLFSALLYWSPHLKETSVCSGAHALLQKTLKRITHPNVHSNTTTHPPSVHLLNKYHPKHRGPTMTFAATRQKTESGQHFGKGRAFHVISDWLILGKRSANNHCHWAVMDEVAGAGHRSRSQDRRLFTAPWLPSR